MNATNQFMMYGKLYMAADCADPDYGCRGCALDTLGPGCAAAPKCSQSERSDGRDVIFVEVTGAPAGVLGVLRDTDWPLLQQQKLELIKRLDGENWDILDGLVSFLDALRDAAVAEGIATEEEVFGKSEEEN